MTTIQEFRELKEKLNALCQEIEEQLEATDTEARAPYDGGMYYILTSEGEVLHHEWCGDGFDQSCMKRGLIFETEKEALLADKKCIIHKKLIDIAGNDGKFIPKQTNYCIVYDHRCGEFNERCTSRVQQTGIIYSQNDEFAAKALEQIGEADLKLYMGIE